MKNQSMIKLSQSFHRFQEQIKAQWDRLYEKSLLQWWRVKWIIRNIHYRFLEWRRWTKAAKRLDDELMPIICADLNITPKQFKAWRKDHRNHRGPGLVLYNKHFPHSYPPDA